MIIRVINDRNYYEIYIVPYNKPIERLDLTKLLRFLKNDFHFYEKELIKANLFNTLAIDCYIKLLFENFELIKKYVSEFN